MKKDNLFWCYRCRMWRSYDDWIVKRSLGDSEAEVCRFCVRQPAEDQLEEFTNIVRELSE